MRLLRRSFTVLLYAGLILACQETPVEKDTLNVSPSSLSFGQKAEAQEVTLTSNCSWKASSDADWVHVSTTQGGASQSGARLQVSVQANGGAARTASITFSSTGSSAVSTSLSVSQEAYREPDPEISVTPASLAFAAGGGTQRLSLTANGEWTSSCSASWLSISPAGGSTGTGLGIEVKAAENEGEARSGQIIFTRGSRTLTVKAEQAGRANVPTLTVAEFLEKPVSDDAWYRLSGQITQITSSQYGDLYVADETGEVYVYGLTAHKAESNDQSFESLGLKEGYYVTFITCRSEYHGDPQAGGTPPAYYESHREGELPARQDSDFIASDTSAGWMELPETNASDGHDFLHHTMWTGSKEKRNFSLYWDYEHLVALWVAYPMNASLIGSGSRTDKWALDPLLPRDKQPVLFSNYAVTGGGYSRGHQIASADRLAYAANLKTFYFTNMTPQESSMNGAIWADLENDMRIWSKRSSTDTLYVVTGCDIAGSTLTAKDNDGKDVTVPVGYYKTALRLGKDGSWHAVAFYFENRPYEETKVTKTHAMTVDALEEKVGINFFVNLPDEIEAVVEAENPAGYEFWWDIY